MGRQRAGDKLADGLVLVHWHWPVPGMLTPFRLFKPFLTGWA